MNIFLAYYCYNEIRIKANDIHQARRKAVKYWKVPVTKICKVKVYLSDESGVAIS